LAKHRERHKAVLAGFSAALGYTVTEMVVAP